MSFYPSSGLGQPDEATVNHHSDPVDIDIEAIPSMWIAGCRSALLTFAPEKRRSSQKLSQKLPFFITMVHGDVVVLSGDRFEVSDFCNQISRRLLNTPCKLSII
jgi:hypothetical protein